MEADFYMTPDRPREDKQSRPPERLQRLRSCSKNEPATSIVLKASAVAARMTTTEKTEARPYCNGSSPCAVNSKENEARPSRNGSSSSQLTLEVFSGVGGSGRRPVSPPTPEGLEAWGAICQPGVRVPGRQKVSFRRVGFRGVGQGAEVIKVS